MFLHVAQKLFGQKTDAHPDALSSLKLMTISPVPFRFAPKGRLWSSRQPNEVMTI